MAGDLTPVQLHDLAVTLENEQAFYNNYRAEDRELKTLASVCPELNMANYTEDDVRHLNDWAIEMSLLVE